MIYLHLIKKVCIFGSEHEFMQHTEGYVKSNDSKHLYYQQWLPDKPPRGQIFLVHGFSEHSGRYAEWILRFVEKKLAVNTLDLRGHGKSEGQRGHTPSYQEMLNDIGLWIQQFKLKQGVPSVLYGQSLGGNLVLSYMLEMPDFQPDGIISTSPWLKLVAEPKTLVALGARILRKIAPSFSRNSGLDINLLSHDPSVAEDYVRDPLNHSQITPTLFFGTQKAARKIQGRPGDFNLPVLLMHGSGDKVTSFRASQKLAQDVQKTGNDITFVPWNGLFHELHHEYEQKEVFQTIIDWLNHKFPIDL